MKRIFAAILGRLRRWLRRRRLRRICNALDIIPFPWQAEFSIAENPGQLPHMGRRTGKTMAVILRALVQPPPINKSAPNFIALDPDADISLAAQHCIYDSYRNAHAICVKARAIPNRPPLPLRTIPLRLRSTVPPAVPLEDVLDRYREQIGTLPEDPAEIPEWIKKQFGIPPKITIRTDGFEVFMCSLREIARAQAAAATFLAMASAATGADLIAAYATPKETHYMIHGRKARMRKKYRNRVLRRTRRIQKKGEKHEQTTPCA